MVLTLTIRACLGFGEIIARKRGKQEKRVIIQKKKNRLTRTKEVVRHKKELNVHTYKLTQSKTIVITMGKTCASSQGPRKVERKL